MKGQLAHEDLPYSDGGYNGGSLPRDQACDGPCDERLLLRALEEAKGISCGSGGYSAAAALFVTSSLSWATPPDMHYSSSLRGRRRVLQGQR